MRVIKYGLSLLFLSVLTFIAGPALAADVCYLAAAPSTYYSSINDAVAAAVDGDIICVIASSTISSTSAIANKSVKVMGMTAGLMITRTADTEMFSVGDNGILTCENIILDGGAVWSDNSLTAIAARDRTNSGLNSQYAVIGGSNGSTVNLNNGAVIQNCSLLLNSDAATAAAICVWGNASTGQPSVINMYDGATVKLCTVNSTASSNYAAIVANEYSTFNLYGGTITACASIKYDCNSAAAVFVRNQWGAQKATFNMSGNAQIMENYDIGDGAVLCRNCNFTMSGNAKIYNTLGAYGGGVLIYAGSTMVMRNNAAIYNNQAEYGGGVFISAGSADPTNSSSLVLYDSSAIYDNQSTVRGGGVYIQSGTITTLDHSAITGNSSTNGGGIYLSTSVNNARALLIGGEISGNTAGNLGSAVFHAGVEPNALNLNAASVKVEGDIYLHGDGSNTNARVVTLVSAPSGNTYSLDTEPASDAFNGRDVVRPGSVTVHGITYALTDASPYYSSFTHTVKGIREGAYYYGAFGDTSHDAYLVLVEKPAQCVVTFDSQGGSAVASQTVAYGSKVTVPVNPTYTGFSFGGWFINAACTTAWDFANDVVTSDITLYAKWTAVGATVTPTSSPTSDIPQTGDSSNIAFFFLLALLSLVGLLSMMVLCWHWRCCKKRS